MKILVCDSECVLRGTRYPLKDALEDIGHRVDMFDWSYYFPRHTDMGVMSRIKSRLFERTYIDAINKHLCSMVSKVRYDLMLVMTGRYIYPETLQHAKKSVSCVANWHMDDIFNMKSSSAHAKSSISLYDLHFTPRSHLIDEYIALGAKYVFPLGCYYRPGLIRTADEALPDSCKYKISFVGAWSSYREEMLFPLLSHGASVFGWGWTKKTSRRAKKYLSQFHPAVPILSVHDIFYQSAINVNLLTLENRDMSNLRNFEIPAALGFQLAERSDEILEFFDENSEIICFSDKEELESKCEFYLRNDSARRQIARAGHERLLRGNYSLEARMDTVVKHVKDFSR